LPIRIFRIANGRKKIMRSPKASVWLTALGLAVAAAAPAVAENAPGVTKTEIKIGQTMPYSGPASAYGTIGKTEAAYFKMINDEGGIDGRKLDLISLDDGYNPARTVQQVRDLVEQRHVAFLFNTLGTPPNMAIQKYLNDKKIPQLFVATGADHWGDYQQFPWTIGWQPSYQVEARIYAKYILKHKPGAKIAVLYQDDDFGKDYLIGLKDGLGAEAAKMIVSTQSYETSDPTVDSQIVSLQSSGADTLLVAATPKAAAQSIHKVGELGWKPLFFMTNVSISVATVMKPGGLQNGIGIITAEYGKDPTDPTWKNDPGMKQYEAFMAKYYPGGQAMDVNNTYGYGVAQTMVQVLKQCGNDLSRANIMKQATDLNMTLPLSLPGIKIHTSPTDYHPITQMQLAKFNGKTWVLFGEVLSGAGS
jgi:branched-chain amino acid transport system substrate-binding protein